MDTLPVLALLAGAAGGTYAATDKPELRTTWGQEEPSLWKDLRLWLGGGLLLGAGALSGDMRTVAAGAGVGLLAGVAATEVVRHKTLKLVEQQRQQLPAGAPMQPVAVPAPPGAVVVQPAAPPTQATVHGAFGSYGQLPMPYSPYAQVPPGYPHPGQAASWGCVPSYHGGPQPQAAPMQMPLLIGPALMP